MSSSCYFNQNGTVLVFSAPWADFAASGSALRAIPENREFQKWKLSFFCQRHTLSRSFDIFIITYRVTNFLPKLVNMLLFSTEKTEFPFLVFPYFRVMPALRHARMRWCGGGWSAKLFSFNRTFWDSTFWGPDFWSPTTRVELQCWKRTLQTNWRPDKWKVKPKLPHLNPVNLPNWIVCKCSAQRFVCIRQAEIVYQATVHTRMNFMRIRTHWGNRIRSDRIRNSVACLHGGSRNVLLWVRLHCSLANSFWCEWVIVVIMKYSTCYSTVTDVGSSG